MSYLLDTNIAIHLRDGDAEIDALVDQLTPPLQISVVSRIELEADIARATTGHAERAARLDALLEVIPALEFGAAEAAAYRRIVTATGYSRRKVLDRMIAAQAIVADATLVTRNGEDFREVPGLRLLEW